MSAERSTESIIDLLYGELSEEQEREMRAELAESPELQAEVDEYDLMLGRVRDAMPLEEVPPNIHASILEAARVAAAQPDDRLIRRSAPEKQGFWERLSGGQGSRIALVAAVLIAGAFVVRFVDHSDSPLHAPASDISSMREAAPAAPSLAASDEEALGEGAGAAQPEDELAMKEFEPTGGEAIADQWSPDTEPPAPSEQAKAESPEDSLLAELQRSNERTRREDKADVKAPSPEPATTAKPAPRPRKKRSAARKSKDSNALLGVLGDSDDRGYGSSTRQPQVQGKAGLEAAAEQEEAADGPSEYRPAPGSISEVDAYFRRGDYGGAISAADEFLGKGTGSKSETANAMFIKAQSLAKQGRNNQAETLLENIKKNYPGWRSAAVDQQLNEIQRKTAPKKQRRKAKPKMDDVEKSAPDSMYNLK